MPKDHIRVTNPTARIRWLKQRDDHSCVPVALLNLIKWSGNHVNYRRDYLKWSRRLRHSSADGASARHYGPAIQSLSNLTARKVCNPALQQIDEALIGGKVVVLKCAWKHNDEIRKHLLLITARTDKSLFLVNTFRGHAWFTKRAVKSLYLEKHKVNNSTYPTIWIVSRNV